jgi:signal transduction histidine kinase
MKFSIQIAVILIVGLLFLASLISVYFALGNEQTAPLILVAGANIVAVILLTFLITRGVLQPLHAIRQVISKVGRGDLFLRIKKSGAKEMEELQEAFNGMIIRVQRAQEMKTEFVSLTAHQLRTPLSAIKWSTKMLLDGDAGTLAKAQQELLKKSFASTDRMIRLINDLLNVARIEEGHYLYRPALFKVGDIVKSMVESYQDAAQQKKIGLLLKGSPKDIPQVLVDAEKIQLAVQNLLDNALHYTKKGGKVTVEISHDTKEMRVSFTDTGIGIPKKQQSRVFEKFFRATNARKVDTDGSGLGLYLVHNIVEAHGGKVWFESEEGKGTTFTFSLPINNEL